MAPISALRPWLVIPLAVCCTLLATAVLAGHTPASPAGRARSAPSDGARAELRRLIEDVVNADGRRYGTRDSAGRGMDTAKIIHDPVAGGYLAVYHSYLADGPHVFLATSGDMLTWTVRRDLGRLASQAAIAAVSNGGFLVVWEQEPANHFAFLYFNDRATLLAGTPSRRFDAPRTLSTCSEGTPNIYSITLSPDIDHSTIDVGGHYHWNCDVDREQRGTLTNFRTWRTSAQPLFDNALLHWGVCGNIGDRDALSFRNFPFGVIEGQYVKDDFGSWRSFVFDYQTGNAEPLTIRTNNGSTAFANPAVTVVPAPDGRPAIVVSMFIPGEGAAAGEGGQLIYYRKIPGG